MILFLLALATARLTQLITEDHLPLIAKPRQKIVDRNPDGNLAYLVNCWWCVSVYTALGAAAFWHYALHLGTRAEALMVWPAMSMSAVMLMGAADWLTGAPDHE